MRSNGIGCDMHIGIDMAERADRLVGELLEQSEHALARLAGRGQIFERRLVGGGFHGARIVEDEPLGQCPACPS